MKIASRLVWDVGAQLGEGPMWHAREAALWFVDIRAGLLHRYDPATGGRRSVAVGGQPSFIVPAGEGGLLVGSGDTLRLLRDDRLGEPIARVPMPAWNRTNDATVDAAGRLWFGTMDDAEREPTGAIHLFDGQAIRHAGGDCTITNGPAVSGDGRTLFHVNTLGGTILRSSIGDDGTLTATDVFARIDPADGFPDGVTLDAEAHLWVGLWGGGQARRYDPEGRLVSRVDLPCANVTKVAFGGPDLRTGYVTTARTGLPPETLAAQPLAGGLFAFDAPAPGLALPDVRLGERGRRGPAGES